MGKYKREVLMGAALVNDDSRERQPKNVNSVPASCGSSLNFARSGETAFTAVWLPGRLRTQMNWNASYAHIPELVDRECPH
jgi:hypothetical protein